MPRRVKKVIGVAAVPIETRFTELRTRETNGGVFCFCVLFCFGLFVYLYICLFLFGSAASAVYVVWSLLVHFQSLSATKICFIAI